MDTSNLLPQTLSPTAYQIGQKGLMLRKDVMFYDDKGRVIQRCSTNIFGKVDREYLAYDFAGNVTKRKVEHGKPGTTSTFTETLTFTFDAMGRPLKTTHKAGTATSRTVNNRIYDSVGRLSSLSRINPPVAALTQTYSYNIRSWLTAIGGTLFREEIDYCTGNDPRWDGKISGIRWKNPSETAWRSYRYSYDGLSRLTEAEYDENGRSGAFTERYGYDLNGNMRTRSTSVLGRDGQGGESPMLSLNQYAYVGNRLGPSFLCSYTYDACGRLTGSSEDMVRSTEYNEIGLPLEMTLSDCSVVRTVYAADGRKLRETTVLSGTSATRSYSGSCIFEGNTLKKVLFEGGYAQMSGSTPSYMFFLTDHLGSVRVVAAQNADVRQVNQYYPFGDLIADSHVTAGTSDNRYRFIGKEFGERTGLYDFSARYLEPSMGRFTTIDPLAEKYPSVSPYVYCSGDPVNRVDPDGREPVKDKAGTAAGFVKEMKSKGRQSGNYIGQSAHLAMLSFGETAIDIKHMRKKPVNTGLINKYQNKYIYTTESGWIDMAHFMFYAGKAYNYKCIGEEYPVGKALQTGLIQELSDLIAAPHSAFSYEDLTSDKAGATFGATVFDPNSEKPLADQLLDYLLSIGATSPENAPNYDIIPQRESKEHPSKRNFSSHPFYVKNNND